MTMDATVLSPQPGNVVVATDDDHGHHWDHHHDDHHWERYTAEQQAAGFRSAAVDAQTTMRDIKDVRFDLSVDVGRVGTAAALASSHTDGRISDIGQLVASAAKDSAVGFKDQLVTAYQIESRALLDSAKNAAALGVQADKNWYQTNLEAARNQAAIVLQGQQLAATAAAQLAECCCEIREKITADGDMTRSLINSTNLQDQRDRAAKAEGMLNAYFARPLVPVTPV